MNDNIIIETSMTKSEVIFLKSRLFVFCKMHSKSKSNMPTNMTIRKVHPGTTLFVSNNTRSKSI